LRQPHLTANRCLNRQLKLAADFGHLTVIFGWCNDFEFTGDLSTNYT